ncbi:MAG: fibrillarin-like rRNA/tRNA 2'-O-methyltransferase [Candidatus Diapherotrites archaeon]|nr:fibrillarin-like rRNA/tRNA 2'-O-methyltransferase [Candidatus Diapherotrites archaeon]
MTTLFPNVFKQGRDLFTLNLVPGSQVYGEFLRKFDGKEFRQWDPSRSKLGAALLKGLKQLPIKPGNNVLYLGAAEGTTASHVADIVGSAGVVLCVDVAPVVMSKLNTVAEVRENMIPLLADSNFPEQYAEYGEAVKFDVVFQDIAQSNQVQIFVNNCKFYLKSGQFALLALKAMSIDSTVPKGTTLKVVRQQLREVFEIVQELSLEPFEKEHSFFLVKML